MKMFNFDFVKPGERDPVETENRMLRDLNEAKAHCRRLFEGRGRAIGAKSVRIRENGPVIFSWPEAA